MIWKLHSKFAKGQLILGFVCLSDCTCAVSLVQLLFGSLPALSAVAPGAQVVVGSHKPAGLAGAQLVGAPLTFQNKVGQP